MKSRLTQKNQIPVKNIVCLAVAMALFCFPFTVAAGDKEPVDVVLMTNPFGTDQYHVGAAFERVFHKAGSWVRIKHQETPGGLYMLAYMAKNRNRMATGKIPHTLVLGTTSALDFIAEGRPPFDKFPWPTTRTITSVGALTRLYATFDRKITSLKDLAGKRVATAQRTLPFMGILIDKPLFGKGLGIYDRIDWAPLGRGGKDALLNGRVAAVPLNMGGKISQHETKGLVISCLAPNTPALELINSGRNLHFLEIEKSWVQNGFDYDVDQRAYPVPIEKSALSALNRDMGGLMLPGALLADSGLPEDIVREIIRVRHEHRKDFAQYHAILELLPDSPYPFGSPKEFVHPAVFTAMKRLGLALPRYSLDRLP
jgi:TRAP-type uncharacterized transport system substrate-binding protein